MSYLPEVLAELAHDFTISAATGASRALSPAEIQILAEVLRDCAGLARAQAITFDRIVAERNQLLAVAQNAELIAFAKAGAPRADRGSAETAAVSVTIEPMLRLAVSNPAQRMPDLTQPGRDRRLEVIS